MRRTRLPLPVLPLAFTYLAVALNMTIASVAIPTLSTAFAADASQLAWIVNITPMTAAAFILFAGAWSDRVGRKRILLLGVTVFLVSALASGFAASPPQLIVARAFTGLGSALAMPAALALTFDVTSGDSQRTAVGIMGGTQAIGALLGPVLGGAALVVWGWQAAFWSVVPLLLLALVLNAALLPPDRARSDAGPSLDAIGAALTALAGVGLLYAAVTAASPAGHVGAIAAAAAVGIGAAVALVWWERRAAHPLFDAVILRRRTFWVSTAAIFVVQFTLGGLLFLNTQYVQLVLGFSPLAAGLFLVPALLMWTVAAGTAGITARAFGVRTVTSVALAVSAVGLLLLSRSGADPNYALFVGALVLTGVMGVAPALMTHTAVSNYPAARRSVGSAINSVTVRFGLAFGVAGYATLFALVYGTAMSADVTALAPAAQQAAAQSIGGAVRVAEGLSGDQAQALIDAARAAFVAGFRLTVGVAGAVVLLLAGLVLLLPRDLPAAAPPRPVPADREAPSERGTA